VSTLTNHALPKPATVESRWKADSLSHGLLSMLISNVFQRGLGVVRNIAFCYFLVDSQLGIWLLVQSFFVLAAPLAVLGLPGSYVRFIEHYRQHNMLGRFLGQTALVSLIGYVLLIIPLLSFPNFFGNWLFGSEQSRYSITIICSCLISVILFNTIVEVANGLRQIRMVSRMHFCSSLAFTVVGLAALLVATCWQSLAIAFAISNLVGCLPALPLLKRPVEIPTSAESPHSLQPHESFKMWQRLLPYATSIWLMNLLSNLFDVCDRYMLLYWIENGLEHGRSLLGQYHSARIFPLLLLSLGTMLSGILMPYITVDWESGRRDRAGERVTDSLKLSSIALWSASLGFLSFAPLIFNLALSGRYQAGLEILPTCLVITILSSLTLLAQNYLWCAERGRITVVICAMGLLMNIGLNLLLIPRYELQGAVMATCISNLFVLAMLIIAIKLAGCRIDRTLMLLILAPISLLLGSIASALVFAAVLLLATRTSLVFAPSDIQRTEQLLSRFRSLVPKCIRRHGLFVPVHNADSI
jgi:O-antigen/teichoic acid export membrane protein